MAKSSRNILLDIVKLISAIGIVLIHSGFLFDKNPVLYQLLINGFFRTAVSFFFCITGYYFVDIFKGRFKNWAKKILILYVVWMFIYSFFWLDPDNIFTLRNLKYVLTGFSHLWFLIALLLGGIILYYLKDLGTKSLILLAVLLNIIGLLIQYFGFIFLDTDYFLINKIGLHIVLHRNFLFFALPYLTIGYLIRRDFNIDLFTQAKALRFLLFSSLFLIADCLFCYWFIYKGGMQNLNLSFLFFAPALLLFSIKFNSRFNFKELNGKFVSQYATIVYLLHPLIIGLVAKNFKMTTNLLAFVVVILTLLFGYGLTKLKQKYNLPM